MSFKDVTVPHSLYYNIDLLHQGEETTSGLILLNIGGKEFMTKVWLRKKLGYVISRKFM